jgi:hypothetical protein
MINKEMYSRAMMHSKENYGVVKTYLLWKSKVLFFRRQWKNNIKYLK